MSVDNKTEIQSNDRGVTFFDGTENIQSLLNSDGDVAITKDFTDVGRVRLFLYSIPIKELDQEIALDPNFEQAQAYGVDNEGDLVIDTRESFNRKGMRRVSLNIDDSSDIGSEILASRLRFRNSIILDSPRNDFMPAKSKREGKKLITSDKGEAVFEDWKIPILAKANITGLFVPLNAEILSKMEFGFSTVS